MENITTSLDKWIKAPPAPAKNTYVFVDAQDLNLILSDRERVLDFKRLRVFLEEIYGKFVSPVLYLAGYEEAFVPRKNYLRQERTIKKLERLGFEVKRCVKYGTSSGEVIKKGSETSLAIDLYHYAHPSLDAYDKAVVLCGDGRKYERLTTSLREGYDKHIIVLSLSDLYESNYEEYETFIDKTSVPCSECAGSFSIPGANESDKSLYFESICAQLFSDRAKARRKSFSRNCLKASIYVDYGNVHHSFQDFKRRNPKFKGVSEAEFFTRLREKAERGNNLTRSVLWMGVPKVKISELKSMRRKKEALKKELERAGYEVNFLYHEVLYQKGIKERGVDLSIAVDAIRDALSDKSEKIILVSGDADFVPVVRKLSALQKQVEVWSFVKPILNSPLSPFLAYELSKSDREIFNSLKPLEKIIN
ncbi:MAG: NYN domain-containing protein [Candidatus Lokiarchaeota archaeon]|nr:NYN domain-containing protein [Candidatus Lokiarchaeota archaeon]